MTENIKQEKKLSDIKKMQEDYEVALIEKNRIIEQLSSELTDSGSKLAKAEGVIDGYKTQAETYKAKYDISEAKYLQRNQAESKVKQQEEALLDKLFDD